MGFLKNVVLYFSSSARAAESVYNERIALQNTYVAPETLQEIERVADENKQNWERKLAVDELLAKDPDEDVEDELDQCSYNQRDTERDRKYTQLLEWYENRVNGVVAEKKRREDEAERALENARQKEKERMAESEKEKKIQTKSANCSQKMEQVKEKEHLAEVYFATKPTDEMKTERTALHIDKLPDQANLSLKPADSKLKALTEEEMSLINLCCTLSAPFIDKTAIKEKLDTTKEYSSALNNPLCIVEGIFRDCIGKEPGREKYDNAGIREGILVTAVEDGHQLANRAVIDYQKGLTNPLSQHIVNSIFTINLMLQGASAEDITDPSSGCGMAIKSLTKIANFIDSHEEVKNDLAAHPDILAHCRGWKEFSEICTRSQQQVKYLSSDQNLNGQDLQKFCGDVSAELNLQKLCKDTMQQKKPTSSQKVINYWQNTTNRSKIALENYSLEGGHFPFIVALGMNHELAEKLRAQPVWEKAEGSQSLSKKDVLGYIYHDLPEKLQNFDPFNGEAVIWQQGVKQLSQEISKVKMLKNKEPVPVQAEHTENVVQSSIESGDSPKKNADGLSM